MLTEMSVRRAVKVVALLVLLAGCRGPTDASSSVRPSHGDLAAAAPATIPPTHLVGSIPEPSGRQLSAGGLSDREVTTLLSLEQVDDHPLYTMHYDGSYEHDAPSTDHDGPRTGAKPLDPRLEALLSSWTCSLFAALGDVDSMLYGRNFDWEYSPALLLFTDAPEGYASVSMVDIAYLGFSGASATGLTALPLLERRELLSAPFLPFDGMNEHGLAIGMAAVPPGQMRADPAKATVGSLMVMRKILDHARNIDEAVDILQSHNIDTAGGPPLHYMIAARSGRSVLVEFFEGEVVIIAGERPWHLATNFLRASMGGSAEGECWRYDTIRRHLMEAKGQIAVTDAMDLLSAVSQSSTQWSVVYGMSTGDVSIAMGRRFRNVHSFSVRLAAN
jgi:hypothetical protein